MNRIAKTLSCSLSAAFAFVGWLGCADETPLRELREGCSLTSECRDPLVCAFRRCHIECKSSRDCPDNGRCVEAQKPYYVCQFPEDSACVRNSDCSGDQVCSRDGQCRDQCATTRDCLPDQTCIDNACADERELDAEGKLPVFQGPPPEGEGCLRNSDCQGDLVCKAGACTVECVSDKDCFSSWTCQPLNPGGPGRCFPPTDGGQ